MRNKSRLTHGNRPRLTLFCYNVALVRPTLQLILLLILPGCSTVQDFFSNGSPSAAAGHMNQSTIDRLAPAVRKDFEQFTRPQHRDMLAMRETAETIPAQFKRRLAVKALKQPWDGLADLERHRLLLADIAEGGALNLPALLDVLEAGIDRTSAFYKSFPLPASSSREHLLAFMAIGAVTDITGDDYYQC